MNMMDTHVIAFGLAPPRRWKKLLAALLAAPSIILSLHKHGMAIPWSTARLRPPLPLDPIHLLTHDPPSPFLPSHCKLPRILQFERVQPLAHYDDGMQRSAVLFFRDFS